MTHDPSSAVTPPAHAADLKAVLDAKVGAFRSLLPRFPAVTIYKVMGKMFAIVTDGRSPNVILKCDPDLAEILRAQYSCVGHRSHLDPRFWIAVELDGDMPEDEIHRLAAHSYDLVTSKLTRKQKAELSLQPR